MEFRDSNVDARQSTFNQVGRDLHDHRTTIHNYHIYISPCGSRRRSHRIGVEIDNDLRRPIGNSNILPPRSSVAYSLSETAAKVDAAVCLIDQLTELLSDSNSHWKLALELQLLQTSLTLIRSTVQKYDKTPLAYSLANTTTPEVLRCSIVLQELIGNIHRTWLDITITSVGGFQRRIWWGEWARPRLSSLRKKLSHSRQFIQGLLMAMHSYVLVVIQARTSSDRSHLMVHMKCHMDGSRRRITCWLCIPPEVS
jgi:hypothetical protein